MKMLKLTSAQGMSVQMIPMALTNLWDSFVCSKRFAGELRAC